MLLAPRTAEHEGLFRADREAVFFGSNQELLDKVQYYLTHGRERERIAKAGYERCHKSDYSSFHCMKRILEQASSLSLVEEDKPVSDEYVSNLKEHSLEV